MPTAEEFRSELRAQLRAAERAGKPSIDINAGELHRKVGDYPGPAHRMPNCCNVMRKEMRGGDSIVSERASDGASSQPDIACRGKIMPKRSQRREAPRALSTTGDAGEGASLRLD